MILPDAEPPPVGLCAQLACIWEATARKPGNVHRYRDFDDVNYLDFLASAAAIGPVLAAAPLWSVGETVLRAIKATRQVTATNTNLGIVLLLAPLATVLPDHGVRRHRRHRRFRPTRAAVMLTAGLRQGLTDVLDRLGVADSRFVYQAIRLAVPGGLGEVPEQDVRDEPTLPLGAVMALAADRDLIARQYVNGFAQVFDEGVPALRRGLEMTGDLERAIVFCHLHLMAAHPDSLIQRKRGLAEAGEASRRARHVLDAGWPTTGEAGLRDLDDWLRADGHRRNPGTTADLVTACLFVTLRQGIITLPVKFTAAPPPARK